jgi:hypothetical protein
MFREKKCFCPKEGGKLYRIYQNELLEDLDIQLSSIEEI